MTGLVIQETAKQVGVRGKYASSYLPLTSKSGMVTVELSRYPEQQGITLAARGFI
jgi:hypothetical protein